MSYYLPSLLPRESTFRRLSLKSWKRLISRGRRSTVFPQGWRSTLVLPGGGIPTPPPPQTNITPETNNYYSYWLKLFKRLNIKIINLLIDIIIEKKHLFNRIFKRFRRFIYLLSVIQFLILIVLNTSKG